MALCSPFSHGITHITLPETIHSSVSLNIRSFERMVNIKFVDLKEICIMEM